jgi:S1-C subfamily serine protease
MKNKFIFSALFSSIYLFSISNVVFAQAGAKQFLDKNLSVSDSAKATYYRTTESAISSGSTVPTKIYYMTGEMYFEGNVKYVDKNDASKNILTGNCTWYYTNGNKMYQAVYNNEGKYDGTYYSWHASGKLQKTAEYTNGKLANNKYTVTDEKGHSERVFVESFDNNSNHWNEVHSPEMNMDLTGGNYTVESKGKNQVISYINVPMDAEDFSFEMQAEKLSGGHDARYGIIFGMKDADNMMYFIVDGEHYKIAGKMEGINTAMQNWTLNPNIDRKVNTFKILKKDDKIFFSLNGTAIMRDESFTLPGNNFGIYILDPCKVKYDNFILKEFDVDKTFSSTDVSEYNLKGSGSGFLISKKGYVVTNNHVIENAKKVYVEVNGKGGSKSYEAKVIVKDEASDLAILQIPEIDMDVPFGIRTSGLNVGDNVFALGYPLALSGMGKEVKFVDGKISAKTGYNNSTSTFQISVPVQPGNSGCPLFDNDGNLTGIVNAKLTKGDNVSYAVKTDFLKVLMDVLPDKVSMEPTSSLKDKSLTEKIQALTPFVTLIKVK